MFLPFIWALVLRTVLTSPAQEPQSQMIQSSAMSNSSELYSSLHQPSILLNASSLNAKMFVECDGESYGHNLNRADCQSMKSYLVYDSRQFTFGQRDSPEFEIKDMFPLPYRILGGK